MMRSALLVTGFVVILVVAYWAGTQFADVATAAPAAPRVVERVAVPPVVYRIAPEDRQQAPVVEPPAEPVRGPTEAIAIVEAGIRDGTWSAAERDALRAELVHLEPAEIDQVLSPLFQAINAQRVRLDGPPI